MSDPCPVAMRGIVPSLNTPFTEEDDIDEEGLRCEVDHVVVTGCVGILALAVASESASLSPEEADRAAACSTTMAAARSASCGDRDALSDATASARMPTQPAAIT